MGHLPYYCPVAPVSRPSPRSFASTTESSVVSNATPVNKRKRKMKDDQSTQQIPAPINVTHLNTNQILQSPIMVEELYKTRMNAVKDALELLNFHTPQDVFSILSHFYVSTRGNQQTGQRVFVAPPANNLPTLPHKDSVWDNGRQTQAAHQMVNQFQHGIQGNAGIQGNFGHSSIESPAQHDQFVHQQQPLTQNERILLYRQQEQQLQQLQQHQYYQNQLPDWVLQRLEAKQTIAPEISGQSNGLSSAATPDMHAPIPRKMETGLNATDGRGESLKMEVGRDNAATVMLSAGKETLAGGDGKLELAYSNHGIHPASIASSGPHDNDGSGQPLTEGSPKAPSKRGGRKATGTRVPRKIAASKAKENGQLSEQQELTIQQEVPRDGPSE